MATLSADRLDKAIPTLCTIVDVVLASSLKEVPVSLIQQACALLDIINSRIPTPRILDVPLPQSELAQCSNIKRLECVCSLMVKSISVFPLLDDRERQHWCYELLESAYQCFKSLRFRKLIPVPTNAYCEHLLQCSSDCLTQLQTKSTDEAMLLILLRIMYSFSCQGFPQSLDANVFASSLAPYFRHASMNVRLAARSAGYGIIFTGEAPQHLFFLDAGDIRDIVCSFGKQMVVSSSLRLILSHSQIAENRRLFLKEGILMLAVSVLFLSQRPLEKSLAFQVIKLLCMEQNTQKTERTINGESSVLKDTVATELQGCNFCQDPPCDQRSSHMFESKQAPSNNFSRSDEEGNLSSVSQSNDTNHSDSSTQQQSSTKQGMSRVNKESSPQECVQAIASMSSQHQTSNDSSLLEQCSESVQEASLDNLLDQLHEKLKVELFQSSLSERKCEEVGALLKEIQKLAPQARDNAVVSRQVESTIRKPMLQSLMLLEWRSPAQVRLCASLVLSLWEFQRDFDTNTEFEFQPGLYLCVQITITALKSPRIINEFPHSEDIAIATTLLLKVVNKGLELPFVLTEIPPVEILEPVKQFIQFSNTEVRILSLVIINKINHYLDTSQVHPLTLTKGDAELCLSLLQKQSSFPTFDLLSVFERASHSMECQTVFEELQVFAKLEAMELDDKSKTLVWMIGKNTSDGLKLRKVCNSGLTVQISFLQKSLIQLGEQADRFKTVLLRRDVSNRDSFINLKDTLIEVQTILLHSQLPPQCEVFQRLKILLLNIISDILQVLVVTDEKQHQKWSNHILFTSLNIVKEFVTSFTEHQALHILDSVLQTVANVTKKGTTDQVIEESLLFCLRVLEDLLYTDLCTSLTQQPLLAVRDTLLDGQLLLLPRCKSITQLILSFFLNSDEDELAKDLCITPNFVSKYLKPELTSDDAREVTVTLRKTKALARVYGNRQLFRDCGVLQLLETLLEKFPGSVAEPHVAELICSLLSDPSEMEEDTNDLSLLDEFLSDLKDQQIKLDSSDIEEFIAETSTVCIKQLPEAVIQHAKHILALTKAANEEFRRLLCEPLQRVKTTFLNYCTRQLVELHKIYEGCTDMTQMPFFEEQVAFLFRRYLPQLSCISLKAMDTKATADVVERMLYATCLSVYISSIHECIERWSRMGTSVQLALADHGAFHLLLTEFSSAGHGLITPDILCTALTSLYNVVLNPNLAMRFRIVITKELLKPFLSSPDVHTRCITKFSLSCMHRLLSRSELNHFPLDLVEVDMLARYLNGVDTFFGGQDNLLLTIENLAHIPSTWQLFVNAGIVHKLASLVLTEGGFMRRHALKSLLNMIPQPEIVETDTQERGVNKQIQKQPFTSPASNVFTKISALIEFIEEPKGEIKCCKICKGIQLLTSPLENPESESIETLYMVERYPDCWRVCELLLSEKNLPDHEITKALLYQAKCIYHEYHRELAANLEKSDRMPGFDYKEMMGNFCKRNIVKVINILSKCTPLTTQCALSGVDEDVVLMLDKALCDCLRFNSAAVQVCLLCHKRVKKKLIRSHYLPKFVFHGLLKTMGLDKKENLVLYQPTENPTDMQVKSVSKLSFLMFCHTCDNEVISQDENNFANNFFCKIYDLKTPLLAVSACCIPYDQYLYRFVAGLMFRNIALLLSEVCTEIGEFRCLLNVMHAYREVILNKEESQFGIPKLYVLALPSELPPGMEPVQHWNHFVSAEVAPYAAYKLLRPGMPMTPKKLYCWIVKLGVLLFVAPFDEELEHELEKCSPGSLIQFNTDTTMILIPNDQNRAAHIPQKLLWSLRGWAKKSMGHAMSTNLSIKLPTVRESVLDRHLFLKNTLRTSTDLQVNLLPPGFALNFDELVSLPEKVVEVPDGHTILLHQPFQTRMDTQGYVILAKNIESNVEKSEEKKGKRFSVYSTFSQPYVLLYLKHTGSHMPTFKAGFFVNMNDYQFTDFLPGCPPPMKNSEIVQAIIPGIPVVLHTLLRSKGFRNLQSLLFWHESVMNANTVVTENMIICSLDTRCLQKCMYCKGRCDFCLKPCLNCDKYQNFPGLETVQTCSRSCSDALLRKDTPSKFQNMKDSSEQFAPNGHMELFRFYKTYVPTDGPGLNSVLVISVCQRKGGDDHFKVPSNMKYIKFWQRDITKPYCIEYFFDEQFNPVEMLSFEGSDSEFSMGEEKEMIHQFHKIFVQIGLPYRIALDTLCTTSP